MITVKRIQEIVKEEVEILREERTNGGGEDHEGVKKVFNSTIDLLKSIDSFLDKATDAQRSSIESVIEDLKRHLDAMKSSPSQYLDVAPTGPKKVVLRAQSNKNNQISDSKSRR